MQLKRLSPILLLRFPFPLNFILHRTGLCACKANWGGSSCTKDLLKRRKVWLGSQMSPLPAHLLAVCSTAITEKKACPPGHALLADLMCAETAPWVEGGNCGRKSVASACVKEPAVRCPGLCTALLNWYCELSEWDAGLVRSGKAPGSEPAPVPSPAAGAAGAATSGAAAPAPAAETTAAKEG